MLKCHHGIALWTLCLMGLPKFLIYWTVTCPGPQHNEYICYNCEIVGNNCPTDQNNYKQ